MAVAWDNLGRAAQKRGIEGQITIIIHHFGIRCIHLCFSPMPSQKFLFIVSLVEPSEQWPVSSGADFNFASEKTKAGGFSAR